MKQKSRYRGLIISCAFVLISSFAFAQTPRQSTNPKALKKYNEALVALEDNRSTEGIALLANVLQIDSNFIDAYLSLAGAYGNIKQYKKAIIVYERARLKDSIYFTPYLLPYAINLAGLGQFEKALAAAVVEGINGTHQLSQVVRRTIGGWVGAKHRRRPMIVPLVIEV